MKLVLVRHGQSQSNVDRTILHQEDFFDNMVELTDLGKNQAREAGLRCHDKVDGENTFLYYSPYTRTKQTKEEFLSTFKRQIEETIEHPLLIEQEFKDFANEEEVQAKKERRAIRGKMYYRYKNGESPLDVFGRVVNFLNEIKINHNNNDTVIVIAHEVVIRCMLHSLLKMNIEQHLALDIHNCEINVLESLGRSKWTLSDSESKSEILKQYIR